MGETKPIGDGKQPRPKLKLNLRSMDAVVDKSPAPGNAPTPERRILRCKIFTQELLDCGFDPESPDAGWSVICGIMKAKGLPSWCWQDRTPFRMSPRSDGIELEFEG